MKTKKILSTILATTLLVGTMVGCGTTSSTQESAKLKVEKQLKYFN